MIEEIYLQIILSLKFIFDILLFITNVISWLLILINLKYKNYQIFIIWI
jgi:hypothetical protein